MELEVGDIVLCTVENVERTIVFVKIEGYGQGSIITSEIAPGRIKNMRQYVVPNKKIVCKVLKASGSHVELSLRRVNSKEKKEVMQTHKQEQATEVAFKQILGDKVQQIKEKILKDLETLTKFVEDSREDKKLIEKYIPKPNQESIAKLTEKRKKSQELKQNIKIKCLEDDGIKRIKKVFNIEDKNISITYISAGQFRLKLVVEDFKQGKKRMTEILEELEEKAKKNNCEFFASEEK